jgi:hypothetical protein
MQHFKTILFFATSILIFSCKSSIKENTDAVYSRHLQAHIPLTIITTPMPDKKEDMNLLLFNGSKNLLDEARAKKIIDSLYKKKLIQPLMLVAFDGKEANYGLTEKDNTADKQIEKYNKFIDDELYPFVKKKSVIRKFNSVAICGFMNASKNTFEVAFNDDNKFQMVGMFSPQFNEDDFTTIQALRKRPTIKLYVENSGIDSSAIKFSQIIASKQSITECKIIPQDSGDAALKKMPTIRNFAGFLMWAFPK